MNAAVELLRQSEHPFNTRELVAMQPRRDCGHRPERKRRSRRFTVQSSARLQPKSSRASSRLNRRANSGGRDRLAIPAVRRIKLFYRSASKSAEYLESFPRPLEWDAPGGNRSRPDRASPSAPRRDLSCLLSTLSRDVAMADSFLGRETSRDSGAFLEAAGSLPGEALRAWLYTPKGVI